jgi:hypothetical protein
VRSCSTTKDISKDHIHAKTGRDLSTRQRNPHGLDRFTKGLLRAIRQLAQIRRVYAEQDTSQIAIALAIDPDGGISPNAQTRGLVDDGSGEIGTSESKALNVSHEILEDVETDSRRAVWSKDIESASRIPQQVHISRKGGRGSGADILEVMDCCVVELVAYGSLIRGRWIDFYRGKIKGYGCRCIGKA